MDKVRKPINSVCYTPSSEPYRIYFITMLTRCQLNPVSALKLAFLKIHSLNIITPAPATFQVVSLPSRVYNAGKNNPSLRNIDHGLPMSPLFVSSHKNIWRREQRMSASTLFNDDESARMITYSELGRTLKLKLNSVAVVRKRTIPTERSALVGEVNANLCASRGCCVVSATNSHGR
jgi:hypothetical protein